MTIEACCKITGNRGITLEGGYPFVGRMYFPNVPYYMNHSACTDSTLNSKWMSSWSDTLKVRTLTISDTTVKWWLNGVGDTSAPKTKDIATTSNPFSIFGWDWNYSFPESGKFCFLRIYNKALTAEEIAHNFKIDKIRFNIE